MGIKTDPGWNCYAGSRIPTIPESQSKTAEHIESLPNSDRNSNKHELNPRNINYFVSNMSDKKLLVYFPKEIIFIIKISRNLF